MKKLLLFSLTLFVASNQLNAAAAAQGKEAMATTANDSATMPNVRRDVYEFENTSETMTRYSHWASDGSYTIASCIVQNRFPKTSRYLCENRRQGKFVKFEYYETSNPEAVYSELAKRWHAQQAALKGKNAEDAKSSAAITTVSTASSSSSSSSSSGSASTTSSSSSSSNT